MALQPSLNFQSIIGNPLSPNVLEVFIDYVCPFSGKIARSIEHHLKPLISTGGKYDGKVRVIIRLHPQPWHAASTYTHEAAIAVGRVEPTAFWPYTLDLFDHQEEYFDIPSSKLTPLEIRAKLVELASKHVGANKAPAVQDLLALKTTPNGGNAVTDDLKYNIKFSRAYSIHVSPTAVWNGLIAGEVSSSYGEKEWALLLQNKLGY